jgi:D-alanyl-D-alanine carboxypeptidase (penicillin-binding protein 5/6)
MKTLALLLILASHSIGIWNHLPATTRDHLTTLATADHPIATLQTTRPQTQPPAPVAVGPLPIRTSATDYSTSAKSALAIDTGTGTILYAKDSTTPVPIASVTKLVTALVILSRHQPADSVTLPQLPQYQPADERLGLVAGETYTVADLLRATIINSANDAADTLALADAGSTAKFAARMNAKMAEWGISGTHFNNPTGLVDEGNFATADALGKIARLTLTNDFMRSIMNQQQATITSATGRTINLQTTNKLLATGEFYGIKTGYTPAAGECFVGLTRIDGHEVITVILGSGDRFGATQSLVNWISRSYTWL